MMIEPTYPKKTENPDARMNRCYRLTVGQEQAVWTYGFLVLPILFYGVIRFYPTANAVLISFLDGNLLGKRTWAGADNYIKLWTDPVS